MISLKGNHITITKGDSGSLYFNFKTKCKPFNLNGWTVAFLVKQKGEPDSTAIISLSSTISIDTNQVVIALTTSNTTQDVKTYDCTIRLSKDSDHLTVWEGIFTIEQGV